MNEIIKTIEDKSDGDVSPEIASSIELMKLGNSILYELSFAQNRIFELPEDKRKEKIENLRYELYTLLNKIRSI
jgi:hypothetical protein